jgi:hypothetical protein
MVLLRELKSSVKNPLEMKSFYVLFVTAFALLLVPLTVIGVMAQRSFFVSARNSCAVPVERSFSGKVSESNDGLHIFTLKGANCSLAAWVNGSKNVDLSLWVYEPNGKIHVVDENKNKSYEFLYVPEPVNEGDYRLTIKLKSGNTSNYKATVSLR